MAEKNFIDEIFSDEKSKKSRNEFIDKIYVNPSIIENLTLKDHFRWHIDTILYQMYMKYNVPLDMIKIIKLYIQNY